MHQILYQIRLSFPAFANQVTFRYPWNQVPGCPSRYPHCALHFLPSCWPSVTKIGAAVISPECLNSLSEVSKASGNRTRNITRLIPFLGELCGEVGGEDSCEDALDIVSSDCFLWRSKLPSSDNERIFFKACGELMPLNKNNVGRCEFLTPA